VHFSTCHQSNEFILHAKETADAHYNAKLDQILLGHTLGGLYIDAAKRRVFVVGYSLITAAISKKRSCFLKLHGFYVSYTGEVTYHTQIWNYECPLLSMVVNGKRTVGKNTSAQIAILKSGGVWYLHFDVRNAQEDPIYTNSISVELDESNLSVTKIVFNEGDATPVIDPNITEHLIDLPTAFYHPELTAQSPYYTYFKN